MEQSQYIVSLHDKVSASCRLQCVKLPKVIRWEFLMAKIQLLVLISLPLFHSCIAGQQWSENYARLPGAKANDPAIIDGKLETIGQSQRKKGSGSVVTDLDIPSEAIIFLPEKKAIYRIVIHSPNLEEFALMALDSQGEWDKFYDQRSNKKPVLDISLKRIIRTTGIKLVVRRTTEDAAKKRENVQLRRENVQTADGKTRRGRYLYHITGPTTALAKIAEIELYGYASNR